MQQNTTSLPRFVVILLLILSLIGTLSLAAPTGPDVFERAGKKSPQKVPTPTPKTPSKLKTPVPTPTNKIVTSPTVKATVKPTSSSSSSVKGRPASSSAAANPSSSALPTNCRRTDGGSAAQCTQPKKCPSSAVIAQYLHSQAKIGANTIFYSSPATNQEAGIIAKQLNPPGHYFGDLITNDQQLDWLDECGPGPEQDKLTPRISKAIAMEATGTAYLLVHKGSDPKSTSIWMKDEFPTLQRNTKITSVKKVTYGEADYINSAVQIWPTESGQMLPASKADD